MKISNVKLLGTILLLLIISSCGKNERPVYQGAEYYKNLEVPPDLTEPSAVEELKIPKPTDDALQRFRDNNKLETVITPKFDGVRMVNFAGNSWIETDNDVEHVWPRLIDFWQNEGIKLVQVRPMLGFMETDWVERLGGEKGFFRSMFQKFEPDQKDKFRVRVERFDNDRKTRIYIANSRIERVVYGEYSEEFTWVSLPSNVDAEREILNRMALFAGKTREETKQLLDNYRPYTSLVRVDSTNTTALTMEGSMDFVWRRAMRALDRMRMLDIQQHPDRNSISFVVGEITDDDVQVETDEIAESSWLMNFFKDSPGENPAEKENRQYSLVFTDLKDRIQIEVKDASGARSTDDDGDVYGSALAEQLRNILVDKLE